MSDNEVVSATAPAREPRERGGEEGGRVVVTRGGRMESSHSVDVAVVDARGRQVAGVGDPGRTGFLRSAAKPFQALPLVEDGVVEAMGLTSQELAVACASHNGESRHLELARSILAKAGLDEGDLECGPHAPMRDEEAHRLWASEESPEAIHNNCSGKHAGMLALAVHHGWKTSGYVLDSHPVQRRMAREVARWTGAELSELPTGVDGCGVVTYLTSVEQLAVAFARFGEAAAQGEPAATVVSAMTGHPFVVAGSGRLDTALMEQAGDRLFVKTGAEGVYGVGLPGRGLGVALKVRDGAKRASRVALVRVLEELGVIGGDEAASLGSFRRTPLENTLGDVVGEVHADFELVRAS